MLFAFSQFSAVYGVHSFIFLRSENPYSENYGMAQEQMTSSGFVKVGEFNTVLSKKIAGDFRHSDIVCIGLFVIMILSAYVFVFALGQLDTRKNN